MTTITSHLPPLFLRCSEDLLTPAQVATTLGLSHRTLAAWRSSRRNPLPYLKVGSRVRYRSQDVSAWLESQTHAHSVSMRSEK
ncbi:helix-turn-helix domain-containing protein [Pseudomonas sp. BNK-6]|uniref:helix-turn-helix domain-containing protein n=1 Tax=unclassified Pseudomonas TaxID=196821 RepID=UPI00273C3B68|nr:helix-turn-helix domain-containing protein [Pseudomonas sp. LPH60]MDP4568738.1 helix-turn-helix domain-containing protein [Pseudomonas sp. LPH60]